MVDVSSSSEVTVSSSTPVLNLERWVEADSDVVVSVSDSEVVFSSPSQTLLTKLDTQATTELQGSQFNSYCNFNDTYLACADDKLCNFLGNTFDDLPIDAYFELAQIDFGIANHKRLLYVYLTFEATEDDILEVIAIPDEDITKQLTMSFTAVKTGKQSLRSRCPRGATGTYWTFRVRNTLGADFAVSKIEVETQTLGTRRR